MVTLDGLCWLSFDGASRGFPRQSGAGCILYNEHGYVVYEIRVGLGDVSNVAAEYLALIYGMRTMLHLGMRKLQARGDSQVVVSQVGGHNEVEREVEIYHREVKLLAEFFEPV